MLGSLCAFVLALTPQSDNSLTAFVDDPGSHGNLGDHCFSLNEAIQLANGDLEPENLSGYERSRVWGRGLLGSGGVVDRILIDAGQTPTINLQRALTPVRLPV